VRQFGRIIDIGHLGEFCYLSAFGKSFRVSFSWKKIMEKQACPRKPYTSDLSDGQWEIVCSFIPTYTSGRPRTTNMREVLNAIFYLLANGCGWRNLPHDFPPEGTVRHYFHLWRRTGLLDKMHDTLREQVRVKAGREPTPSAGSIDSQSVKSARTAGLRGFDAGKKSMVSSDTSSLIHLGYCL
jgi:transposase